jgi:ATP-dependent protease ClpP protease subunit
MATKLEHQDLQDILDSGVDLARRRIYVIGEIDAAATEKLQVALDYLETRPGGDPLIQVLINSEGGEEGLGYGMYDAIRGCAAPVHTIGIGSVMSVAALVFQAGRERYLTPNSRFMIHAGSMTFDVKKHEQTHLMALGRELEAGLSTYARVLASHSGQDIGTVLAWCKKETFFDPLMAIREGFADFLIRKTMGATP